MTGIDILSVQLYNYTDEYRKECDKIQKFIDDCCIYGVKENNTKTRYKYLNDAYIFWCNQNGEKIDGNFSKKLSEKGYETCKINGGKISCKKGIRLKQEYLQAIK